MKRQNAICTLLPNVLSYQQSTESNSKAKLTFFSMFGNGSAWRSFNCVKQLLAGSPEGLPDKRQAEPLDRKPEGIPV
jgi:hypothetical protein